MAEPVTSRLRRRRNGPERLSLSSQRNHFAATHLLEQNVDIRVIQVLLEATTYYPPTPDRGADLLSVPSAVRRDGAYHQAIRLPAPIWWSFRSPTDQSPVSLRG